jgi:ABC-type multidrug transport system ATPase subunit
MLLERFGLWEERHARVATFSRGMQQRLALCRTLLHEPQLVLLDEPFSALDAGAAALVDRELRELAGSRTVVLSTHAPERVEALASARLALAPA